MKLWFATLLLLIITLCLMSLCLHSNLCYSKFGRGRRFRGAAINVTYVHYLIAILVGFILGVIALKFKLLRLLFDIGLYIFGLLLLLTSITFYGDPQILPRATSMHRLVGLIFSLLCTAHCIVGIRFLVLWIRKLFKRS